MKELNSLTFCTAELQVAIQEYLNRRWTVETPQVDRLEIRRDNMGSHIPSVEAILKRGSMEDEIDLDQD